MKPRRYYDPGDAADMHERRMDGETLERIGADYGVRAVTVRAWVSRYVRSGAVELVGGFERQGAA